MNHKFKGNNQQKQNREFADLFGPFMPTVRRLQYLGHLGSGLLQFFVLRKIVNSHLSDLQINSLMTLSIIFAIGLSIFIEIGFTNFVKVATRQVTENKFRGKAYWIMFLFFGLGAVGFMYYSPWLSANGGKIAGNDIVAVYNVKSDTLLYQQRNKEITINNQTYNNAISNIKKEYGGKIQQQENKRKAAIQKWDAYWNEHHQKEKDGVKWASSHKEKAVKQKKKAKAKFQSKIDLLLAERNDKISIQENKKSSQIETTTDIYNNKITNHNNAESATLSRIDNTRDIISDLGFAAGFVFVFICFVCIIIQEVFYSKTKIPRPERHNWNAFFKKLDDGWQLYFWEKFLRIDLNKDGYYGNPKEGKKVPSKPRGPKLQFVNNNNQYTQKDIQNAYKLAKQQAIAEERERVEAYQAKKEKTNDTKIVSKKLVTKKPNTPKINFPTIEEFKKDKNDNESNTVSKISLTNTAPVITALDVSKNQPNEVKKIVRRYSLEDRPMDELTGGKENVEVTPHNPPEKSIQVVVKKDRPEVFHNDKYYDLTQVKTFINAYLNKLGANTIVTETFLTNMDLWLGHLGELVKAYHNDDYIGKPLDMKKLQNWFEEKAQKAFVTRENLKFEFEKQYAATNNEKFFYTPKASIALLDDMRVLFLEKIKIEKK